MRLAGHGGAALAHEEVEIDAAVGLQDVVEVEALIAESMGGSGGRWSQSQTLASGLMSIDNPKSAFDIAGQFPRVDLIRRRIGHVFTMEPLAKL